MKRTKPTSLGLESLNSSFSNVVVIASNDLGDIRAPILKVSVSEKFKNSNVGIIVGYQPPGILLRIMERTV